MLARLGGLGNRSTIAALASAGVGVTSRGDPSEQEAARLASQVASVPEADQQTAAPTTGATGGPVIDTTALPPVIGAALSGGSTLPQAVRGRLESATGTDLSAARVHTGSAAAVAAESVGARAFTLGSSIVIGAGESVGDVELMAHEAAHVAQHGGQAMLLRDQDGGGSSDDPTDSSIIPDVIMDAIRAAIRALPGYTVVSIAVGSDLLTGQPMTGSAETLIEQVLAEGLFGEGISLVLKAMQAVAEVSGIIQVAMASHNLTLARVHADIAAAWAEVSVTNSTDANVAIVGGYLARMIDDVKACAQAIADTIIEIVRAAVADLVEPHLTGGTLGPIWSLAKKVMHYDPLRAQPVDAPTVEILADFLHLIGKDDALAQMTERGTLQQTADWLDTQIATFRSLCESAALLFTDAWAAIQPGNLANLLDTLPGLAGRAVALFGSVVAFGATLIVKVLELVKSSLLAMLSERAHGQRGFRLLTVILGRDPFTDVDVPRSPENLIAGFITLLPNGEATYAQLAESGVIAEAAGRIESAMTRLNISWEMITGTFRAIWDGLGLADLLDPVAAFVRIINQFGEPLARIIEFIAVVIQVVVELILRLMNFPSDLLGSIIASISQAVDDIQRDPILFLNNMLAAVKSGFGLFFDNIVSHLVQGLADWLFRGLQGLGITVPTDLSGASVLNLVLQVLGLSVELLWERLGVAIGPEKVTAIRGALDKVSGAWSFITDVQERGMVAIWDYVQSQLGQLWDTILAAAEDWIMTTLVEKAIAKVLSMLDPTGVMAVVNSFIAFFNAVQSVIEYVTDILRIIKTYVDTLASIAKGDITPGAAMLERGLGQAIPVAIGFLANQVGLGNIPEKIVEIIEKLRVMVIAAIDWMIAHALRLGQAALDAFGLGAKPEAPTDPSANVTGVKAAAAQDLATAAQKPIDTPQQLQVILDGIMAKRRAEGLISLEVRASPTTGHFSVLAEASPQAKIGEVLNHAGAPADPNQAIKIALDALSTQTHCFAEFGPAGDTAARSVHYQNDPGALHAEQVFLNDLDSQLAAFPPGVIVPVRIKLNRLPCKDCAPALNGTASSKSARMSLRISATSIYGGSKLTNWLVEDGEATVRPDKYIKAKKAEIEKLVTNTNVVIDVWDIWSVISESLMTDARLAGLDPELVRKNLAGSGQLQGYLQSVRSGIGARLAGTRSR